MLGPLRPHLKPALRRLCAPLARAVPSPHAVTLAALPLAFGCAVASHAHLWKLAFALGLMAALVDLVDGTVAELQQRATPFGNYLETMVDKVVEVVLLAGLASDFPTAAALAIGAALLVGFAKARVGLVVITDNRDWPAIGDRADRMFVLLTGLFFAAAGRGEAAIGGALWIVVAVCSLGLAQRVCFAHTLIAQAERDGTLLPYLAVRAAEEERAP